MKHGSELEVIMNPIPWCPETFIYSRTHGNTAVLTVESSSDPHILYCPTFLILNTFLPMLTPLLHSRTDGCYPEITFATTYAPPQGGLPTLSRWLERVLRQIGIRQDHVHLSVKPQDLHSHHCFAALLVVEADPAVPFAEEVITATSTDEALSVQIAAHKMTTKRLLAQF